MTESKRLKKKYPSLSEDLKLLRQRLKNDPISGNDSLGSGCYKVRMELSDKLAGKSGGARVIIQVFVQSEVVYFLSIYDKSAKGTLFEGELDKMLREQMLYWQKNRK